jgi:hypothetical protein
MGFDRKSTLLACFDEAGGWSNQTTHVKRSVALSQLCQGTFIGSRRRQNALGEFQKPWPSLIGTNLISFVRIGAHPKEWRSQMPKMKTISAAIIFSAAVATPVLAQDAGVQGPGSRYALDSRSSARGAYNQLNGPSYAAARTRDHWSPENSSANERDPSIPGGEDTTLRAAAN